MVVLQPEGEARFKRISPTDAAHGRRQRVLAALLGAHDGAHDGDSSHAYSYDSSQLGASRARPLPGRSIPGSMLLGKGVGKGVGKGAGKGDPWSPTRKRRAWEGLQGASSGQSGSGGSARPGGGGRLKYERGWRALQPGVVCTPSSCSSPGRAAEIL